MLLACRDLISRPSRRIGQICTLVFSSRDPLALGLLNDELVFTDLTTGSYARPVIHNCSGWHNIIATHKAQSQWN
eukprot:2144350-Amphidinium_carterae.1